MAENDYLSQRIGLPRSQSFLAGNDAQPSGCRQLSGLADQFSVVHINRFRNPGTKQTRTPARTGMSGGLGLAEAV
jgi:hypothetical protein